MITHAQHASPTAVICENLQYFGGGPNRGRTRSPSGLGRNRSPRGTGHDPRRLRRGDRTRRHTARRRTRIPALGLRQHAAHADRETGPDRSTKLSPELKILQNAQDGSEVQAWELERVTERAQHLGDRRDAFEQLRDAAADRYPRRHRQHVAAEARLAHEPHGATDLLGDRRARLPPRTGQREDEGPPARRHPGRGHRLQARRGRQPDLLRPGQRPKQVQGHGPWSTAAVRVRRRSPRAGPSPATCTRSSADRTGTPTARPRRSGETISCSACSRRASSASPGSGISENLVDKAVQLGIPVKKYAA